MKDSLSVTQLNRYISELLSQDPVLSSVTVCGEISNFKLHSSGHLYFTLKDEESEIRAVMFKGKAYSLRFKPQDGMRVIAFGRVGVYEKSGSYQLYVETMMPDGNGALALAFEELKNRLSAEGLFDESRKRPLPEYPSKIAVITSPTGAAVQDIRNTLGRRYPLAEMLLYPVTVQGETATPEISEAIARTNSDGLADVIIVGRGGGSIEDLWAFNEEITVRAVAASKIPTISAVGHETDVTLCDFAADKRAATPTAAAEIAVPDINDVKIYLSGLKNRLLSGLRSETAGKAEKCKALDQRLDASMRKTIDDRRQTADGLIDDLTKTSLLSIAEKRAEKEKLTASLFAMDPGSVLKRGYSICKKDGKTVSASSLSNGDKIDITFADGNVGATVGR